MKNCTNTECRLTNPQTLENFWHYKKGTHTYLQSRCKSCIKESRKTYEHSDARKAYAKEYEKSEAGKKRNIKSQQKMHKKDPRKRMLRDARDRATHKSLPFNLTIDDILIPNKCPVFKISLSVSERIASPNSPSLDRMVPELGYVKGNVRVISYRANQVKNDGTADEHEAIARWIRDT